MCIFLVLSLAGAFGCLHNAVHGLAPRVQRLRTNELHRDAHSKMEVYYIFLTVWKMTPGPESMALNTTGLVHHSENSWCRVRDFTRAQQQYLDSKISKASESGYKFGYSEVDSEIWKSMQGIDCEALGYGNGDQTRSCLGTGGSSESCSGTYKFSTRMDANTNVRHSSQLIHAKYFYGRTDVSRDEALDQICECGWKWSVAKYNCMSHNCNTFGASVRGCILGLSARNPSLGWSDGGREDCCAATA
eukprot:gnl/TRDRNA2_/TRDRNA2_37354_c0_seq1.p1 gnl/TRDRNA2_/TRDRNA2_37354_c0~~gnl/TRDRNA2_/TRDRNA2_37354_c0_seq1.p1  ORF type:complete len:246 (+),score=21.65 gnl/TRDRNA2_/TRDRNA2_37354_c0_seq1:35-772(+)